MIDVQFECCCMCVVYRGTTETNEEKTTVSSHVIRNLIQYETCST